MPEPRLRVAAASEAAPPLRLSLQFVDATDRALLRRADVRRWLGATIAGAAVITVRVVGADEGRALNRQYRGQDKPTNVLTFDYARAPAVVADIVLCAPLVAAQAQALGIDRVAHYAHLVVHSALHAQGYAHDASDDAARMEKRESELMVQLGFADPYASGAVPPKPSRARRR